MEFDGVSDVTKYSPQAYAGFPAKRYLERFQDPTKDSVKSYLTELKKFHTFYENSIGKNSSKSLSLLEVGGGPTLYTLISAARYVDEITFSDYSESNLEEIKSWKEQRPGCHDWSKYVEFIVQDLEGDHSDGAVERREMLLRKKIKDIITCDVSRPSFFDGEYENHQYDIVQCCGCLEVVINNKEAYYQGVIKLASYIKPGGYLVLKTGTGGSWYLCPGVDYKLYFFNVELEDNLKGIEKAGLKLLENVNIPREDVTVSDAKSFQLILAQKPK